MNEIELKLKVQKVFNAGSALSEAVNELVGKEPSSLIASHVFMVNQHMQDALNRVSNIAALLRQTTSEGVAAAIDEAAAKPGGLKVLSAEPKAEG
ncbi:MAG: hypothetical protein E6R03_16205 [Hyphomicrobiaceae bacterium]|nr:MAG: hypothetical protein E6R03_16205 [Hyphomicrobiaceae bacterium]